MNWDDDNDDDYEDNHLVAMGGWHVVLLVDSKERCHPNIQFMAKHDMVDYINAHLVHGSGKTKVTSDHDNDDDNDDHGMPCHCEIQSLLAGDYVWVARHARTGQERLLDCIIERKSYPDLTCSLMKKSNTYYPLDRMDLQLKKLRATTLPHKWLIVEGSTSSFASPACKIATERFLKQMKRKKPTGHQTQQQQQHHQDKEAAGSISLHRTENIIDTMQWLMDQHEQMRQKIKLAFQVASVESPDDPSLAMVHMEPFASDNVATMSLLNQTINAALDDPTFHYYLALRRVAQMGDNKARLVMEQYPQQQDLIEYLASVTPKQAVKELTKLSRVGKTLATRIQQAFVPNIQHTEPCSSSKNVNVKPAPPTTVSTAAPEAVTPPAPPAAVVTPPVSSTRSSAAVSKRAGLAFLESSDSSDYEELLQSPFDCPNKRQRRLFDSEPNSSLAFCNTAAASVVPLPMSSKRSSAAASIPRPSARAGQAFLESSDSSDCEELFRNLFERPNKRQRRLFGTKSSLASPRQTTENEALPIKAGSKGPDTQRRLFSTATSTPITQRQTPAQLEVIEID